VGILAQAAQGARAACSTLASAQCICG
jgi:hypothetical protein